MMDPTTNWLMKTFREEQPEEPLTIVTPLTTSEEQEPEIPQRQVWEPEIFTMKQQLLQQMMSMQMQPMQPMGV